MKLKKILARAFKSVPDIYVNTKSRIFLRSNSDDKVGVLAVVIAHPTLDHIIWTEEKGWRKLYV